MQEISTFLSIYMVLGIQVSLCTLCLLCIHRGIKKLTTKGTLIYIKNTTSFFLMNYTITISQSNNLTIITTMSLRCKETLIFYFNNGKATHD
jgi:hypothetical protein